jgi:hypothetical protein
MKLVKVKLRAIGTDEEVDAIMPFPISDDESTTETKETKVEQRPILPADYGSYVLHEHQIRGRRRVRLVLTRSIYDYEASVYKTEEKQFWITDNKPAIRTQVVNRNTGVSKDGMNHSGSVHPHARYGFTPKGLVRETRDEQCDCHGDSELVAYWKATQDTIQDEWNRFHKVKYWPHVHGYNYSGLGMYADMLSRESSENEGPAMSDDDSDDPEYAK